MKCKEAQKMMQGRLEKCRNNPDPDFTAHIGQCSSCRTQFEQLVGVERLLKEDAESYRHNPFFASAVIAKVERENRNILSGARVALIASVAIAAIFIGVIMGNLLLTYSNPLRDSSSEPYGLLAEDYLDISAENDNLRAVIEEMVFADFNPEAELDESNSTNPKR